MNVVHIPHSNSDSGSGGVTAQLYAPPPCGQNPDFLRHINAQNGKILAFLTVLSLATYHGVIHLFYGIETCRWILSDGRFQVDFYWQPVVNGSMYAVFDRWLGAGDRWSRRERAKEPPPTLLVSASASWTIKQSNGSLDALDEYRRNVSGVAVLMDKLSKAGTQVLWVLQDPVDNDKFDASRKMITNRMLDLYNEAALEAFSYTDVQIFSAVKHIASGYYDREQYRLWDGLHTSNFTVDYAIQLLYNMYCNGKMRWEDCTCCAQPEALTTLQKVTMVCFSVILLIATILFIRNHSLCHRLHRSQRGYGHYQRYVPLNHHHRHQYHTRTNGELTRLANSLSKLGLIMGYFLICDRTDFFLKENKYFTQLNFFLPICYVFALGLFFTEDVKKEERRNSKEATTADDDPDAKHRKENGDENSSGNLLFGEPSAFATTARSQQPRANGLGSHESGFGVAEGRRGDSATVISQAGMILHRRQTQEWKGWMQLVLLIYHMTGASKIVPIYMHVRVLVTSYLFLTGYNHFSHFWAGGDASVFRLARVAFRLNLLVFVLCLSMNRPYQFYYFVPLVTFCTLLVHVVMVLPPRVTATSVEQNPVQYLYMVLKFVALFLAITILYMSQVLFEKIFLMPPWKALFVTSPSENVREWYFRWKIDRYSTPCGMLFAFLLHTAKRHGMFIDSPTENIIRSRLAMVFLTLASGLALLGATTFAFYCGEKPACNEVHPYVSWLPIVAYITLRNAYGSIRAKYSALFAWFGELSLELFVCQYHVWLSAGTHGVLVLIPNYPVLNVCITSFVLVSIAHEVKQLTAYLSRYAVPQDGRKLLRNVIILLIILLPIGIHDKML
ncbi:N-acetylneuraminate 9-O-acetyltransferase-like isoform X2 [Varroa jacobsoni]|uniref:Cas1p 10 TM acyl transferase domain-containing protein n=1 Tax=Varroa destructor TaxID=109461 RepID=A0A7M7MF02_VARDE|nr:N-acetylneuraminate 9-O-acetyltransferase-like isoform X2 [Varroa destructor]XP_022703788.1 N-acetylneuraminate 9-O-acetyltransferase-like isoform X2 [Varroa jacobsoni]